MSDNEENDNIITEENDLSKEIHELKSFINHYSSIDLNNTKSINIDRDGKTISTDEENEKTEKDLQKSGISEVIDENCVMNFEIEDRIKNYITEISVLCKEEDTNTTLPPVVDLDSLNDDDDGDDDESLYDVENSPLVMLIKSILPIKNERMRYKSNNRLVELNNIGILQKEINNLKIRMKELLLSHKSQLSGLESEIEIQNRIIKHYHSKSDNNEYINNIEREIRVLKPENDYLKMNMKIVSNEMNEWKIKYMKLFNEVLNNSYYFTPSLLRNEMNQMMVKEKEELLLSMKSKLESKVINKNEMKIIKDEIEKENKIKCRLNELENEYKNDIIELRKYLLEMKEDSDVLKEISVLRSKLKESKEIILKQKEYNEKKQLENEKEIRWLRSEIEKLRNK